MIDWETLSKISGQLTVTETNCWRWFGGKLSSKGYAKAWIKTEKTQQWLHIWMYKTLIGPVPEGLELDHLCFVTNCINPDHLEPVTHAENMRRRIHKGGPAAKEVCVNGHPFSDDNVYWYPSRTGKLTRSCKECRKNRVRERRARLREAEA